MNVSKNQTQPSHSRGSLVHSSELPFIQQGENFLYDARLLHKDLLVKVKFEDWIRRRISDYKFENGVDFFANLRKSTGGRKGTDYLLTIDMCKELGMLERSEIGRAIRKRFIQEEKKARGISHLPKETALFKGLKAKRINDRELYPYSDIRERAGYSRHGGGSHRARYWMHFIKDGHTLYVTAEFALHLLRQKQVINNRVVMQAAQPVLPLDFGNPLLQGGKA